MCVQNTYHSASLTDIFIAADNVGTLEKLSPGLEAAAISHTQDNIAHTQDMVDI